MNSQSKRQRRSYSCGPCKLLKIKCDLELPCSACQKFKRESKCHESPPDPPSKEEMVVIQERKQRMSKRRTDSRSSAHPSLGYNPDHQHHQFAYNSSIQSAQSPAVPIAGGYAIPPYGPNGMAPGPGSGPLSSSLVPTPFNPSTPTIDIPILPSSIASCQQLITHPDPLELLNDFFKSKGLRTMSSTEMSELTVVVVSPGKAIVAPDIEKYNAERMNIAPEDVTILKQIFPNNETIIRLFLGHFKTFKEDLLELMDYPMLLRVAMKFNGILATSEDKKTLLVSHFEIRTISICLCIFASGLLVIPQMVLREKQNNNDIVNQWIMISKKIKTQSKNTESLLGMIYLIAWYFAINNYYHQLHMLLEDHFEFNNLLSTLLFNKIYRENIVNEDIEVSTMSPEKLPQYKACLQYWLRMRIIELDVLYFQYKSSLLQSNNTFRSSAIPDLKTLEVVFGQNLTGLKDDILKYSYRVASGYFNNFSVKTKDPNNRYLLSGLLGSPESEEPNPLGNKPIKDLLKKYLSVYQTNYEAIGPEIRNLENKVETNGTDDFIIDADTIIFYIKNQIALMVFVKWLAFLKIEKSYFASLRYSLYITAMLTMFNHYKFLDDLIDKRSNGNDNLLKNILKYRSAHSLQFIIHCIVLQQLFLITVKNFITRTKTEEGEGEDDSPHVLNLKKYFNIIHEKFTSFFTKFQRDFNDTYLKLVPLHKHGFNLINELIVIYDTKVSYEANMETPEFFELLSKNLTPASLNLLVDLYFGCKTTLFIYFGKLWKFFEFIKTTSKSDVYRITSTVQFNDEVIFSYTNKFIGLEVTEATVIDYMKTVVDPVLERQLINN